MSAEAASYAFKQMFIYSASILPTKTLTVSPELILSREADQKCYLQPAGTNSLVGQLVETRQLVVQPQKMSAVVQPFGDGSISVE